MHPILFKLAGYEIRSYTFFTITALLVVLFGTYFFAIRRNFEKTNITLILVIMTMSAFIGARLLHLITNWSLYEKQPWRLYSFDLIGFAIYGGILGAVVSGIVLSRILKFNLWRLGDTAIPFVGLGIVTMRIGCYLNGCCFGKETSLPWGVTFPFFSYAHSYQISRDIENIWSVSPVHPTQLYELTYTLIGTIIAFAIIRKKLSDGIAILGFGFLYTSFRLFNYYFRVPPTTFEASPLFYPIIYCCMLLIIGVILYKKINYELKKG